MARYFHSYALVLGSFYWLIALVIHSLICFIYICKVFKVFRLYALVLQSVYWLPYHAARSECTLPCPAGIFTSLWHTNESTHNFKIWWQCVWNTIHQLKHIKIAFFQFLTRWVPLNYTQLNHTSLRFTDESVYNPNWGVGGWIPALVLRAKARYSKPVYSLIVAPTIIYIQEVL